MKQLIASLFMLLALPCGATTYFMANAAGGGNDSNNGLSSGAPWLTPNHAVNCGDLISAAPGAYSASNLGYNSWGVVTCAASNNVAWVKCATFDACTVAISGSGFGIDIDRSFWGIQGFEVDGTSTNWACFVAWPNHGTEVHHVIFANDIAIGCGQGGISPGGTSGAAGVDYGIVLGSISYNAASRSDGCYSGIDTFEPVASDTLPGTHFYFAGNFAFGNVDASTCAGGSPTDGEGLFFDTINGISYTQQMVMDNNIAVFNGGRGIMAYANNGAKVYFRHNTAAMNNTQAAQKDLGICGEITVDTAPYVEAFGNIGVTGTPQVGCAGNTIYGFVVALGNGTDHVYQNDGNTFGTVSSTGYSAGPNNITTDPAFANPVAPGSPSCSGKASVPDCMSTVIANFTPTNAAAKAYGYQVPSSTNVYDPLYPQWLCSVTNLPTGLVTPGCVVAGSSTASGTASMK